MTTTTKSNQAAFLNIEADGIVYLPTNNSWVRRLTKAYKNLDMLAIHDSDYQQLIAMNLVLKVDHSILVFGGLNQSQQYKEIIKADTIAYFIDAAKKADVEGVTKLSDEGYRLMYEALADRGDCFCDVLLNLEHTLKCWHEGTAEELAEKLGLEVNSNNKDNDGTTSAVLSRINTNPWFTYRQSYLVNGKSLILYSEI